jgi:hypothetical protein
VAAAALVVTGIRPAPDAADPAEVAAGPLGAACRPEPLPVPAGTGIMILAAIDPSGRHAVAHGRVDGVDAQVRWTDGAPTVDSGPYPVARDINRAATMVGWRDGRVWLFRDGGWNNLGVRGEPWALNDRGDIVGADDDGRLVVWPARRANCRRRPVSSTSRSRA